MKHASIIVRADWDEEAGVWVASSNDIEGLAIEADTLEALEPKVVAAITDLFELNGFTSSLPEIPIHIMAEQLVRIPNPTY
ncbi:putative RNase H-like HicB family nuclease [Rhizobium leguminosarum]|uniref:DUF1902 domain-containing protein n=3 Tax=Rhizobium TaxID=379 RepID=A0ABF7QIQ3_RHILW|nr:MULTISPECIES: DUF1902 domain-containing protein [Rhizobium]ACI53886.1 Domain of unknown function DUF1902 [Rhizobium leguminosarum bv. trifolii WSM2304]KPH10154.1 hypothetical protein AOG23_01090 [Rhizobium acidisoli]MBB5667493.1 putative RNase H-like HicB family nuclease [Rhizobium leguminosarum]MBB6220036.1 putative RNase H-like HicB family nuclease [Rhizobium leguminosarum]NYJ11223.1 putative RNase H-like HicB family nuclease [Rhizobium leguminosarum]